MAMRRIEAQVEGVFPRRLAVKGRDGHSYSIDMPTDPRGSYRPGDWIMIEPATALDTGDQDHGVRIIIE